MYTVIGEVMYPIIDEYIYLHYLGLLQETLSKNDNNFKNTKFNDLSGLVINNILMNIMSCHGFVKSSRSTIILTCCNALVPYYIYKVCVIVETEVGGVYSIPIIAKKTNQCYSFT